MTTKRKSYKLSGIITTPRSGVCQTAHDLVNGEKAKICGSASVSCQRIADLWSPILGNEVTAKQVALCMAAMKISREVGMPQRDNLVDLAGYAEVAAKVEAGE